ncbi:hypothetical protein [Candidatus Mesenet endosymbiont of Phosphuga atrata]|uniref:hypothetical protein n=1 Tax=Candidatus Mesenet endosymbiont of Phosphuga atrata TaxID=3066221 RepID=UPI0030D5AD4C
MPKQKQFTQTDFEESIRQRWKNDNPEVALKLIGWNRKINEEIKKELEQKKLKQEKLNQERNKLKEERERTQAQKEPPSTSSSEASQDQSSIKETGAVPKEKRHEQSSQGQKEQRKEREKTKELRAKHEAEKLQKEREKCYPDFKAKLTDYLRITNCQIIFSLFYDIKEVYNKKNNLPETTYISEKNYKKFNKVLTEHIKAYNFVTILNQLLKKDCITVDLQKYKNSDFNISKSATMCGDKITVLFQKIKDTIFKLGITASDYLDYIPYIENIKDIENNLVKELPDLYKNLLTGLNQKKHVMLQVNGQFHSVCSDEIGNDSLFDQIVFDDCINGRKNTSELLGKIMKEHGYKAKVDEVIERLMKKYQPSPSSDVEEASLQDGACAHRR